MRIFNISLIISLIISIAAFLTGCGGNNGVSDVDFTTYTDNHDVFSISYPADWEVPTDIVDESEEFLELYSENPDMSIDEGQTILMAGQHYGSEHNAGITVILVDCPMFFNSINDTFISLMMSGFKSSFEDSEEISRETVTINGRLAAIIELEATIADDAVYMVVMLTINRGQIWTVVCMVNAEERGEYEKIFDTTVKSLVIHNAGNEQITPSETSESNQSSIESIFSSTEGIRGLVAKDSVPYGFISSEELMNRVNKMFEEEYSEEEEEIDHAIYVLLDLVDESDNLRDILIDIQSEQIIGYYDDESNDFYIVNGDEDKLGAVEKISIAHEYTHALQDQHFDLGTLPIEDDDKSDTALAALSLVEGDASLCSFLYAFNELTADDIEELLDEAAGIDSEALDNAPAIISETLMFPYSAGLDFITEAYEQDGWETINNAYSDPPKSTEQIIHPEKYFSLSYYDEPQMVEMPDIQGSVGTKWELKYTDVIGELTTRIYLDAFISSAEAGDAAAGWDGDCLQYWEKTDGEQFLIIYWIWDSPADAEEFYEAYLTFMENKIDSSWDVVEEDDDFRQWQGEDQSVYLSINELNTLVVISTYENIIEDVVADF